MPKTQHSHSVTLIVLSLLVATSPLPAVRAGVARQAESALATISGTIRHDGIPVADVDVGVFWAGGGRQVTTAADGRYLVTGVPTGVRCNVHVSPALPMRLAWRNWGTDSLSGDQAKDFDLVSGHVLSGQFRRPDGQLSAESFWLELTPRELLLPPDEWLGATVVDGRFALVVAPDIYSVLAAPRPYFVPRTVVDLRGADQISVEISLLREPEPPYRSAPPLTERIYVGPPDVSGYAAVHGEPGAVVPYSSVLVANLSARNLVVCSAEADGSFETRLYAPPGSSLLVKEDAAGIVLPHFWHRVQPGRVVGDFSAINPLPGTIVLVAPAPPGDGITQEFESVGSFWDEGPRSWAGWWISGELRVEQGVGGTGPGMPVRRGQHVRLTARVRFTSTALNCVGTPTYKPRLHVHLVNLFGTDGREEPRGIWFSGHLFTPTGLPIEHEGGGQMSPVVSADVGALSCAQPAVMDGSVDTTFEVPHGLPDGVYMVRAYFEHGDVPQAMDVPSVDVWYNFHPYAAMPLLRVGSPAPPRIAWVLLGDYPVDGYRGLVAREDVQHHGLAMRTKFAPHRVVVPRLDERTGEPIAYRLEPGSLWVSSNDRRLPNPPHVPFVLPSGTLTVRVRRPGGLVDTLGPAPIRQSSVRTPTLPGGDPVDFGTGHLTDLFHLSTLEDAFAYRFPSDGHYEIALSGAVQDIYGYSHAIQGTYEVDVARVLDLDPAQLPTTPYKQGDAFAPGLHVFPPVPADVTIKLVQMPNSDPSRANVEVITGQANRFGHFQPPAGTEIRMAAAGEFRVDYTAEYVSPDGTLWIGALTWGNVVEGPSPQMEAHGRRGMDYLEGPIDDMPAWFEVDQLTRDKMGIEVYYPYFSGDVHWGIEDRGPGDSIHTLISVRDLTGSRQTVYNQLRASFPRATNGFRQPPAPGNRAQLEERLAIGEAPLFITTDSGQEPKISPQQIDQWGYWYGSSQRPDVHVREIISEDNMGTAYWRFDDTYGHQIGEPADGDQPGDIKWEFGGAVLRVPAKGIHEYAIYSSLWVLLPHGDAIGARITPPFQDATGAGINGGPILTLKDEDIDMLFLPKAVRPGDVLELGDTIAFSGHVGPPLDSRVEVTITSPRGAVHNRTWHANKIGWLYDPTFDFVAEEVGRWTVDVAVEHDRPYVGNGVIPTRHNTGTVLGTHGRYEFYVVPPDSGRLLVLSPSAGFLPWDIGWHGASERVQPITILGVVPPGSPAVHYTVHDKGVVMDQGTVVPDEAGIFRLTYDARALHEDFSMLSLTASEGRWEGLADEVAINLLAVGGELSQANTVTLIGEEVFVVGAPTVPVYLPMIRKGV
jgi:hypothetical protein